MSESFENAIKRVMCHETDEMPDNCPMFDSCCGNCDTCLINAIKDVQAAHEHEMELLSKQEYHRGYEDGRRSMDTEHAAVALKLRQLRFDEGSHENLHKVAYAIYPCATGWTCESSRGLRDELVRLLGGVSERPHTTSTYDVLGNERHEVVCRLREYEPRMGGKPTEEASKLIRCITGNDDSHVACANDLEETRDRLIHLLGGDEPTAMEYIQRIVREHDRKCLDMELSGAELSQASVEAMSRRADQSHESSPAGQENETGITAEFRECVETASKSHDHCISEAELLEIADRIDEEAEHNEQKIEVLMVERQSIRDELKKMQSERDSIKRAAERDADHLECITNALNDAERERDELQAKLDEAEAAIANWRERVKELAHDMVMWHDRAEDMRMERDELRAKLEEADAAIANWREREKSFDASERLREELRMERDELRERLDRVADALRGVERGTLSAWEAADEVGL